MRTKYELHIGEKSYELTSECVRNWDQIVCAYSRKDFNGVVRSFSSKFEFVGKVYDILLSHYLESGMKSAATLRTMTMTDTWEWETQFEVPLDFSTISWDGVVLSISAVDNGLAALIAARKKTEYEFGIGNDIIPDGVLSYDRVIMRNTVTHEIMGNAGNGNYSDGSVALTAASGLTRLPVYVVGNSESYESSPVTFDDQTEDKGSSFLKIRNSQTSVELSIDITYENQKTPSASTIIDNAEIHLMMFNAKSDHYVDLGTVFTYTESDWKGEDKQCVGCFSSFEELQKAYPTPPQNVYAIIGKSNHKDDIQEVYITPETNNEKVEWLSCSYSVGGRDNPYLTSTSHRAIYSFKINSGANPGSQLVLTYKANLKCTRPHTEELSFGIKSTIKAVWTSRAKTISIDAFRPQNVAQTLLDKITGGTIETGISISDDDTRLEGIYILAAESIRGIEGAKLYTSFDNFCEWMQTVFGYTYYIDEEKDAESGIIRQYVRFVHRKTLFAAITQVDIEHARDLTYSVDSSLIYSCIEVGYDKQDYDAECGRDEWNFTTTYNTRIDVSDKKLSMTSKYRADCYGLEFLAQKRLQDTTDDKSDHDVFFVFCTHTEETDTEGNISTKMILNRSVKIEGALSDSVFNGEFSPRRCLLANADRICAMHSPLNLEFASGSGNSSVVIDGTAENQNIEIKSSLFTVGQISFSTDNISIPKYNDALYSVSDNGITYIGYLSSLELRFARSEAAKYKLIVKEVKL